jgi:TDG/mug DNA glycosylase family protein
MPEPILPDLLQPGLAVVFCGTAAGRRSAADGAYYAHPGNMFWRTLHATGLTPRLFRPDEFRLLPSLGIGMTDLAKFHAGNDADLPRGAYDPAALIAKVQSLSPRVLAFTSKNAARAVLGPRVHFGLQPRLLGTTRVVVLPSPSGQARRSWDAAHWQALARLVNP